MALSNNHSITNIAVDKFMGSWILENWSYHVYRRVFTRNETNALHKGSSFHDELTGARDTELPLSFSTFYFNVYFQ